MVVNPVKKTACFSVLLLAALILVCGCTQNAAPAAVAPAPATTAPAAAPSAGTMAPAAASFGYKDLSPAEAQNLVATEKDLVIIDVSPYYANGHLPNAISIPLSTLDSKIPALDRTKPYLVYCHGDAPSIAGAQKLVDAGFSPVYRLEGNYAAWVAAGYPVEK
jgi:rhodanese-related sulfurtransferase